jgi:hypothetical protein
VAAAAEGRSVSSWVRRALEEKLGLSKDRPGVGADGSLPANAENVMDGAQDQPAVRPASRNLGSDTRSSASPRASGASEETSANDVGGRASAPGLGKPASPRVSRTFRGRPVGPIPKGEKK